MKGFMFTTAVLLSAATVFLSLRKDDCKGVVCNTAFVREGVVVLNIDGDPIELDDAFTFNRAKNQTIRFKDFKFGDLYIVIDDSYQKTLKDETVKVQFIGVKNGKKIFNEPYTLTADCCHIKKLSGKDTIIVDETRVKRR
jgi:hypothetical protein